MVDSPDSFVQPEKIKANVASSSVAVFKLLDLFSLVSEWVKKLLSYVCTVWCVYSLREKLTGNWLASRVFLGIGAFGFLVFFFGDPELPIA
ncbi:hypothetical protein Pla22_36820 [Rubripirellula amarantea]|uniref:Uncharacterized protein n=1 Tax=Rubripirellula amarantea TaxID=2527999 RepID=A0A5C5WLD6_9BACT|nr:hypothetical protein Pla22_36820 [Rubripirellula amarantea]